MENSLTYLSKQKDFYYKLKYLLKRFSLARSIQLLKKSKKFPTEDCFVVICKNEDKYLIAKLRNNYKFCPGDWGFIDVPQKKHIKKGDNLTKIAISLPFYYTKLKTKRLIKKYPPFHWLDTDSKYWWHIFCYLVEVDSRDFQLNINEKFSEFKWIKKEELPKYSRKNYLEDVFNETINKFRK